MVDPFDGIEAKLNRCLDTAKLISAETTRFLTDDANGVINDFKSKPGYLIVKAFSKERAPPILSVLIGEVLYQIRSALHHLACDLTELNQKPVDDGTEFPIFDDPANFRNPVSNELTRAIRKRIGGIDPLKQAIIEEEQPFARYPANPHDDPLWLLHLLSNYDRHKALHATSAFTAQSAIEFLPPQMARRFRLVSQSYGPLEGETEIARYFILGGPSADVHVDTHVRFDIAFGKVGPGAGRPVVHTLGEIAVRVGEIIKRLI